MKVWHEELPYNFSDPITDRIFTENAIFFDIETTGFSPAKTSVYLIGCASRKGNRLVIDQFFAETPGQEANILTAFFSYMADYDTLITFNGVGFDIPYLKGRCLHYHLPDPFSCFTCLDIFKVVSQLKFLLKLPNYKQKSIERFLDIEREDTYNGGELIDVYKSYVLSPSKEAETLLKLHNYEDVLDMPRLLPIMAYPELFHGRFSVCSIEGNEYTSFDGSTGHKELLLTLQNDFPVPKRVSCSQDDFYLTANGNTTMLRIRLFEGELKYFFQDYKNYYYLPEEDTAIPKNVASAVDKEYRKKATAATCYSRKYAIFLPQYEEIITPVFREKPKGRKSYFELTAAFAESESLQRQYVKHILYCFSKKKDLLRSNPSSL